MKRPFKLMLLLVMVLVTLSSCAGTPNKQPQVYEEVTQRLGPAQTPSPTPDVPQDTGDADPEGGQSVFASNPYDLSSDFTAEDAMGEEDFMDDGVYDETDTGANTDPLAAYSSGAQTVYPYAGSTPIPLDPVDMPSPTPHAPLAFTYVDYAVANLGLTFQGPAGWIPDESDSQAFILSEPEMQVRDGQQALLKIYAVPVNSNYSEGNLKTEVLERLDTIGASNFEKWSPSLTASRHLMGAKGVYANYSGTLANGVKVGGRIHCCCIDKVLYCIEITYPSAYKEDYENVFSELRKSIKRQ